MKPLALAAFAFAVVPMLAAADCRNTPPAQCSVDGDCGAGRVCSNGQCVGCKDASGCSADQFCCQGQCLASTDIDAHCGCSAQPTGSAGQTCASSTTPDGLCLVGATTATAANVGEGVCGCGCTPDKGGPTCTAPSTAGAEPQCTCAENSDCKEQSEDAHGVPHQAADTCTPTNSCVCFSAAPQAPCDPNGANPDCSKTGGCTSLESDAHNCGKSGVDCTVDATGIANPAGTCINGGCTCDAVTDCTGNVDSCVINAGPASCVCAGYRAPDASGAQAPCPLELACASDGCVLDSGAHVATEKDLLTALGLPTP